MAQEILFSRFPKEAILVAELISKFSMGEYALSVALSKFLGPYGFSVTSTIFHQMRSISDRLQAFETLVGSLADLSGPCRLMDAIAELKKASLFRNKLAHGVWGVEGNPSRLTLTTWLTSTNKKSEKLDINVKVLTAEIERLHAATGWLLAMGVGLEPLPAKLSKIPTIEDQIEIVPSD